MTTTLQAQHCGWDNSYIIMVEVRDSKTAKIINGLEIVLADSTGKPYTSDWNLENNKESILYQNTDTLKFGQNSKNKSQESSKGNESFPFGLGYYMLLVYYNNYPNFNKNGEDLIIIKDVDGKNNLGYFATQQVKFKIENIPGLCTNNNIWSSVDAVNKVKIIVALKQAK